MNIGYYDKQGKEITALEFGRLHSDYKYKFVMKDTVGGWQISTVWLGLDHAFKEGAKPLIFETMVFEPTPEGHMTLDDVYCERYSTEEEAKQGHIEAMKWLLDRLEP